MADIPARTRFEIVIGLALAGACAPAGGGSGPPGPMMGTGFGDLEARRTIPVDLPAPDSFATVIRVGRMVFVSGQLPLDPAGEISTPRDLAGQSRQAFANLETALRSAGARPGDVVQLTVHVVDLDAESPAVIRAAAPAFFPAGNAPTGTFLGVAGLSRPGALLSVTALAMTPGIAIDRSIAEGRRP